MSNTRTMHPLEILSHNYTRALEQRFPRLGYVEIDQVVRNCRKCLDNYLTECSYLPLIYLDRFPKDICIDKVNIFMVSLIIIAVKWAEDEYPQNSGIAKIFGMDPTEFNQYERDILNGLNYNLYVSAEEYNTFITNQLDISI